MKNQTQKILQTAILMFIGLILLKFIPMNIYGNDILFDASGHLVTASFVLYFLYFFIDQNKSWRTPYFVFSFAVLTIVSLQRIEANAHNDVGLLLGLLVAVVSIGITHWKQLKRRIKF